MFIARTVLRFDMWGDLVAVDSHVVDLSMRNMVARNLPPQDKP